jgi:cyclic pyranopterin phosphate synthase
MTEVKVSDTLQRPLTDLRISVTDRCNYRCTYCMPFDEYQWVERAQVLSFDEIERLARLFVTHGVNQLRLTGGEPLVRRELSKLVQQLRRIEGLDNLSLTTNGALLAEQASALRDAGLDRINVSLDTLQPDRFRKITQRGELQPVLDGLDAAKRVGMSPIKINAVVIRGFNDDELLDLVAFGREHGFEMRLIEYMDVGNASGWTPEKTFSKREMLEVIHARYPLKEVGRAGGSAPAVDYEFVDGAGRIGIIGSVTEPFCSSCTRARLTADGKLVTCLFAETGVDLKTKMREGATDEELNEIIRTVWSNRGDRYSDLRWERLKTGGSYEPRAHKKIEMITLGG